MPYTVETAADFIAKMKVGEVARNVIVEMATVAEIKEKVKDKYPEVRVNITLHWDGSFDFYRG